MSRIEVLGIVGSLRQDSYNRFAMLAAQELMPPGSVLNLFELHAIPLFNQDAEAVLPPAVVAFKQAILAADAILFATPEYNDSLPGVLKNAIDWASRPLGQSAWRGKPGAVIGASVDSMGTVRAQLHLRQILGSLGMPLVNLPEVMIGNAAQRFDEEGGLADPVTRSVIRQLLAALVRLPNVNSSSQYESFIEHTNQESSDHVIQ